MWLLTEEGHREGAYAVKDAAGDKVLYMFEEEDDAIRYAEMTEKEMDIIEVDEEVAIKRVRCIIISIVLSRQTTS